jgi:hypothetical protein
MQNTYKQLTYKSGKQYVQVRSDKLNIVQMLVKAELDGYTVSSYRIHKNDSVIANKASTTNILHILT